MTQDPKFINADGLKADLNRRQEYAAQFRSTLIISEIIDIIDEFEEADVEPVRRGQWIATNDENKKRCSECGVIHLIAQYPYGKANYCPNCGAKMDGDENG